VVPEAVTGFVTEIVTATSVEAEKDRSFSDVLEVRE
jgi:hypothetical protein